MNIVFKKSFIKQYSKLTNIQKDSVDIAICVFMDNPKDLKLKNHSLKGRLKGKRAISAGFDLRIVFIEKQSYIFVEMLAVETHNQVY